MLQKVLSIDSPYFSHFLAAFEFHVGKTTRFMRLSNSRLIFFASTVLCSCHISSIETSDNLKKQCVINTSGWVRLPIISFLSRFSPVVLLSSLLSSMLGSNALIAVDSDLPWRFRLVSATPNKLHPANPTKCRAEALID